MQTPEPLRPGRITQRDILTYDAHGVRKLSDDLVTEEPLTIRLKIGSHRTTLAVTMRTPGNDFELAAGFLLSESLVHALSEILEIAYCVDVDINEEQRYNIVTVTLEGSEFPDIERFERHFTMTSACGICGRAVIERLDQLGVTPLSQDELRVSLARIHTLPAALQASQQIFKSTGGLHAAALFTPHGELIATREDIGRHNALDKLIGWALMERRLPLANTILFLSGRASYELLQKATVAGIPVVAAVSAPSSLAVDIARAYNLTLLGFVRNGRANCYSGEWRLIP